MSTRILRSHSSQQNDLSVSQASEGNPNRLTAEQIMLSNNLQPFDPPTSYPATVDKKSIVISRVVR